MRHLKELRMIFGLVFSLFLFAWFFPSTATASFTITEQELDQLEHNLNKLETLNEKSQKDLATVKIQLEKSEKKSQALVEELLTLKTISETQEKSLATANRLLQQYATEAKKNERKLKRQRAIYATLLIGSVIYIAGR